MIAVRAVRMRMTFVFRVTFSTAMSVTVRAMMSVFMSRAMLIIVSRAFLLRHGIQTEAFEAAEGFSRSRSRS